MKGKHTKRCCEVQTHTTTKKKKDNAVEFANQMINLDKRFYSLIKILERRASKPDEDNQNTSIARGLQNIGKQGENISIKTKNINANGR